MSKSIYIILILCNIFLSFQANVKGVVEIDVSNFDSTVVKSEFVWIIKLYSEMCGSCQEFQPTWEQFAQKNVNKYKLGQVNIDKKPGMDLANILNGLREGIPAIVIFDKAFTKNHNLIFTEGATLDSLTRDVNKVTDGLKNDVTGFIVKVGAKTIGDI